MVTGGAGKASAPDDLKEMRAHPDRSTAALFDQCSKMMLTPDRASQAGDRAVSRDRDTPPDASWCRCATRGRDRHRALRGPGSSRIVLLHPVGGAGAKPGRKQAFEMLGREDFSDAATARERGLVNRVVPAAERDARSRRLADAIAANRRWRWGSASACLPPARARHRRRLTAVASRDGRQHDGRGRREGIDAFIQSARRPGAAGSLRSSRSEVSTVPKLRALAAWDSCRTQIPAAS